MYTATFTGVMLFSSGCCASFAARLPCIFSTSLGTGFKINLSARQPRPLAVSAAYLLAEFGAVFAVVISERQLMGLELKMRTPAAAMRLRSSLWKRLHEEQKTHRKQFRGFASSVCINGLQPMQQEQLAVRYWEPLLHRFACQHTVDLALVWCFQEGTKPCPEHIAVAATADMWHLQAFMLQYCS